MTHEYILPEMSNSVNSFLAKAKSKPRKVQQHYTRWLGSWQPWHLNPLSTDRFTSYWMNIGGSPANIAFQSE
ncbi:MAG: hypothetical protein AMXMBFR84_36040 [Candidatus Hydrogenedentota bacterium]